MALVSTFVVSLIILSLIPDIFADASVWRHLAFDQAVQRIQIHPKAPSLIYVTVEGQGILKTTNGGNSWQKLVFKEFKGINLRSPFAIALHPTDTKILYGTAVVSPIGGLLPVKSSDGGESWTEIWQGLGLDDFWDRAFFETIAVDPNNPEDVYISDPSGPPMAGTSVSRDGGRSWKLTDVERGKGASFFAINPIDSTVYAIIRYPSSGEYITRSLDRGGSWQTIFGFIDGIVSAIAIDPTTGHLYGHGTNVIEERPIRRVHTGMYKSLDKGDSWQSIDNGFPIVSDGHAGHSSAIASLAVDAQHPNTIYAATRIGVYRSQNGGESWHPFNDGLTNLNVHWVAVDPLDASVYAGTDDGLFKVDWENGTFVNPQGKVPTTWGEIKMDL